jgi:hypothetical protein
MRSFWRVKPMGGVRLPVLFRLFDNLMIGGGNPGFAPDSVRRYAATWG